jgi:ribosomal protein S18 acetylase RimI-like enzyme
MPNLVFPLVDEYVGTRLGTQLATVPEHQLTVVESCRRLRAEQSYGYVHALWWVWLANGRSVVSVPPGIADEIQRIIGEPGSTAAVFDDTLSSRLRLVVDGALARAGLAATNRILRDLVFACDTNLVRHHPHADCRTLSDSAIPPAGDLQLPTHCFPDGRVFGIVTDGAVTCFAFAHQTGVMEDRVADIGVETAAEYRRRGFARSAVSALVTDFVSRGGEARYGCGPDNEASKATAASVGFVPYARCMVLSAPHG